MREERAEQFGHFRRIAVVGTTGSGKTTLARALAQRLGYPHIELDALHWEANWTEAPLDVFRTRVEVALRGETWIVDGNYAQVRDLVLSRADTLIWLDYALPIVLWRVIRRTLRRVITRERLWGNNREDLHTALGRDSVILWTLQTHSRRHREYAALEQQFAHTHLRVVRLCSPRETKQWLARFDPRGIS